MRTGALKMRRPVIAPPMRLPREPIAVAGRAGRDGSGVTLSGAELGGAFDTCALRARIRFMCRSRRTITFVIGTGQTPVGKTLCLHIGHNDEWLRRKGSMQSGW